MFPLRGVFLYPRQIMPLHIFEPRYREMIEDVLDGPGRIVMGTILEGQDETGEPGVLPVAGVGEIARHDRLEDGGFNILLFGLARARLTEVDSDRLYRRVRIEPLQETEPTPEAAERVNTLLRAAVMEREDDSDPPNLPENLPTAILVDLLSQRLSTTQSVLERIYSEAEIERRAELALDAHARFPGNA
jgi:Lon protease-like protein